MKILFFGDIVGKIARRAIKEILPKLKEEYSPDLVIANAENAAHGIGVTENIIRELQEAGIDFFTSGDHIFDKPDGVNLVSASKPVIIRPANYPNGVRGVGYRVIEVGSRKVLIINLIGRVFMKRDFDCPFRKLDEILQQVKVESLAAIIVDFHAEATSEKGAMGWYADGRVSAVLGTHTHVPTADAKILPQKTAFVSDVGMVGAVDSIIGDKKEPIINSFLHQLPIQLDIPEEGEVFIGAVLIEVDPHTRQAVSFERLDRTIRV